MQSLKWEDLKGKQVAVHCPTQELAKRIDRGFIKRGFSDDMCYKFITPGEFAMNLGPGGTYSTVKWYRENDYTVISAIDFLNANGINCLTLNYIIL